MEKLFKEKLCLKAVKSSLILLVILLLTMVSFSGTVFANQDEVKVLVDGEQVQFDVQPRLIGGRTMVPLRAIFEALGATVSWDNETQTVTAYNEAYLVKATIDQKTMTVNGESREIDIAPMLVEGRTLVPARFVAEAFNCDVQWRGERKTVEIVTRPIDYDSLESNDESSTKASTKSVSSTVKYYSGSTVPTYTSVTGIELKRVNKYDTGKVYQYPDTKIGQYSEVVDYMNYLENSCGWSSYDTEKDDDSISWYYVKGSKVIGISFEAKYDEIWITILD